MTDSPVWSGVLGPRDAAVVVVDLDSTLADTRHRHHRTPTEDPTQTWTDYAMHCADDTPMVATVRLVEMLEQAGYDIHIVSFRDISALELTEAWLEKHKIPYRELTLKGVDVDQGTLGNHDDYKALAVQKLLDEGRHVALVLDDWPGVRKAVWDKCKVPVLIVNPCYQEQWPPQATVQ